MNTALLQKIQSRTLVNARGCWVWQGAKNSFGYGNTYMTGKYVNAHRAMWIAMHGLIPPGENVLHRCDNPSCVNPSHLFLGSQAANMADKSSKGRAKRGPSSMTEWWTKERKAVRADQTRMAMQAAHIDRADAAGSPHDWKHCPCCETWKPRSEFHKNSARTDGIKPHCKPCSIAKDSERKRVARLAL